MLTNRVGRERVHAEPGPLIAMKLQSTIDRGAAKEGTDLLDIIRLALDRHAGPIARSQLSQADQQLRTAIRWHATARPLARER
jgi:hypothetical protein